MASRPQTFEEALAAVNEECDAVMVRKQLDYGSENISSWGLLGIAVRATDKVMRLKQLLTSGREPQNESLRDTLIDLRNYATIGLMLMDGVWGLPLADE